MRPIGMALGFHLAACLALAACGGGSGGVGGTFSCTALWAGGDAGPAHPAVCAEGSGGTAQDYQKNRAMCTGPNSQFANVPCTHQNALGGCRIHQGGVTITTWYYADTDFNSVADIQKICSGIGLTFVTP